MMLLTKKDIPSIAGPTFVTKHLYLFNDTNIKCIHQKHIIFKGAGSGETGGGKRFRGSSVYISYYGSGGRNLVTQLVSPK